VSRGYSFGEQVDAHLVFGSDLDVQGLDVLRQLLDQVEDDAGVLVAQVEAVFLELAGELRELLLRLIDLRYHVVELVVLCVDLVTGVDQLAFELVDFLVSKVVPLCRSRDSLFLSLSFLSRARAAP
jgi:hypothetical protein